MSNQNAKADAGDFVTVTLFKDSDKYKDDVTIGVNGKFWKIQRGVPVTVPRYVADVLDAHMRAENEANERMNAMSQSFRLEAAAAKVDV